jgi:hypothetical protein
MWSSSQAFSGLNEVKIDVLGQNEPAYKRSLEDVYEIMAHTGGFPATVSHYCHKATKWQYLHTQLPIVNMHYLYVE